MFKLNQPIIKNKVLTWSRDLTGRLNGKEKMTEQGEKKEGDGMQISSRASPSTEQAVANDKVLWRERVRNIIKEFSLFFFAVVQPGVVHFLCWDPFALLPKRCDPVNGIMPTTAYVVMSALVPCFNLFVWMCCHRGCLCDSRWPRFLCGFSLGVSLAYTILLYHPILFSVVMVIVSLVVAPIGIVALGLGIVKFSGIIEAIECLFIGLSFLTPLFACVAGMRLNIGLRRMAVVKVGHLVKGFCWGLGLALSIMVFLTGERILAAYGFKMALSDDPVQSARGVELLRKYGGTEIVYDALCSRLDFPKFVDPGHLYYLFVEPRDYSEDQLSSLDYRVTEKDQSNKVGK